MKIVCYGDSNTYGYDPRLGSPGRLPKNERWTGILDEQPEYEVVCEGMNGRTIPGDEASYRSLSRILKRNMDADILVIMLGTNDIFRMRGPSAVRLAERMRQVFEHVTVLGKFRDLPDKHVFLVVPPSPSKNENSGSLADVPFYDELARAAKIMAELPGEYAKVAEEERIDFIDAGEWGIELFYDRIHFSEAGHRTFAERISGEIAARTASLTEE